MTLRLEFNRTSLELFDGSRLTLYGRVHARLGSPTMLFGENGAGKTMVISAVGVHFGYPFGSVKSMERATVAVSSQRLVRKVAFVRQEPYENFIGGSLVDEFRLSYTHTHRTTEDFTSLLLQLLKSEMDISSGILLRDAKAISSGEQQLVALAMAILADADLILLDEPFARLSRKNARRAASLLLKNVAERYVLLSSHVNDMVNDGSEEYVSVSRSGTSTVTLDQTARPVQTQDKLTDAFPEFVDLSSLQDESKWSQGFEELPVHTVRIISASGGLLCTDPIEFDVTAGKRQLTSTPPWKLRQGITIIYGDNGSGKTLVARVLSGDIALNPIFPALRHICAAGKPVVIGGSQQKGQAQALTLRALRRGNLSFFLPSEPESLLSQGSVKVELEGVCPKGQVDRQLLWLGQLGIGPEADCDDLSYGQRKLVAFSILPKHLILAILDEPFANLSGEFQLAVGSVINEKLNSREWESVVITSNRPIETLRVLRQSKLTL